MGAPGTGRGYDCDSEPNTGRIGELRHTPPGKAARTAGYGVVVVVVGVPDVVGAAGAGGMSTVSMR